MDDHDNDHSVPDSIPAEWMVDGDKRTITVELDAIETGMVMLSAMRTSLKHAFHGCPQETLADALVEKLNHAVETQIKGL